MQLEYLELTLTINGIKFKSTKSWSIKSTFSVFSNNNHGDNEAGVWNSRIANLAMTGLIRHDNDLMVSGTFKIMQWKGKGKNEGITGVLKLYFFR